MQGILHSILEAVGNTPLVELRRMVDQNSARVLVKVEGLNVGDVVDLEGFLYWYNGANPHITKVEVK